MARAVVSIARIPGDASQRTPGNIESAARRALELIGGIGAFVRKGQRVLLKPNQTVFFPAEDGVTTDPWLVAALARIVKEAGGFPVVGDMPGAGITSEEVMGITGMTKAAQEAGAEMAFLDRMEQKRLPVPNGKIVSEIYLPAPIVDCDVLINVPKAKTHFVDPISGAVKNWMGVMRPDVRMRHHDVETPQYVLDATMARPPHLHVMDAIWAGEGKGPIGNKPTWLGCVLASADPAALDVTTARLLGFSDERAENMTYAGEAADRGLGTKTIAEISIVGESLDEVKKPVRQNDVDLSFAYLRPVRVIVGKNVSLPGTIGHFKSVADIWHERGLWDLIILYRGTPTIMIGLAEDPDFEKHLSEGPYVTVDDAVDDTYKLHKKVNHIAGHPVCDQMYSELIKALGVELEGKTAMAMMKAFVSLKEKMKL